MNDTNTDVDRATIQKEFNQKKLNINDIVTETNYNGIPLLDGTWSKNVKLDVAGSELLDSFKGSSVVDAVFLVDTTGSMGGYIKGVANHVKSFVDALNSSGINWQVGIVRYDDVNPSEQSDTDIGVKRISFSSGELTNDENKIIQALNNLVDTLGVGGDYEESGYEGVLRH